MSLWLRPTLALFFWVVCCPLRLLAATTVVQSTDAAIEYTGVWEVVMPNSSTAYAVSNMSGSKAVYTFTGTKISVFGVVLPRESPDAAQVSQYSVDGGTPTQYTAPGDVTEATYNLQFFSSSIYAQGQHTLTILNLGDEFILGHFEVTSNPSHINPTESDPGPTFTTTSREPITTTSTLSSTFTSLLSSSTTQSSSSHTTSTNNGTLTSTSTSTVSSTLPSTTFTSTTSSTSILATSSTSPPDSTPTQGHITTLSKGVTIGGGIAGTLGFLFLVGGVCWWGQRRGRRKRQGSSGSSDSRPPLGMHAATSQVTLGSDPFASERLRIGLPIYIPVGSASDLSNGGSQYTPTQGPSRAGHLSEKYGMDGAPLHSPVSTSNLLDSPNYPHYAPASPAPPRFDTPMQVRRMDVDERRRSADGGVRIAGGRPGQRVDSEDPDDSFLDLAWRKSIGSTLPPAYDFD